MPKFPKNIGIVYRIRSERAKEYAKEVAEWLHHRKLNVFSPADLPSLPLATKMTSPKQAQKLDLVIVLGGDGTFLSAVRMLQAQSVPILGVHLGHLGFLTENKADELFDVLKLALKNKIPASKRATFMAKVIRKSGKKVQFLALNDIVVERGPNAHLIDLSVYYRNCLVSTVKADGVIVATPTGSTAYCLAAGGPIVHPEVPAMTITPICPHTLTNRPIILPDDQPLRLKLIENQGNAVIMVDGQKCAELSPSDELIITKSQKPTLVLSLPQRNYFEVLRAKLRFGERH
ncbi:MAG: NAD(+)/NADH kinase [Oligoflexia bacterium]|nr:NAD(+)/NADH kinase [Oligoflexia bacterium]